MHQNQKRQLTCYFGSKQLTEYVFNTMLFTSQLIISLVCHTNFWSINNLFGDPSSKCQLFCIQIMFLLCVINLQIFIDQKSLQQPQLILINKNIFEISKTLFYT